jgi:hypothetical protein
MRPSTSFKSLGVRTGYLGVSDPPAYILSRTSLGRVSWLLHQLIHGQKREDSQDIWLDDSSSTFDTLYNFLSEGTGVTVGRVESDSDDRCGPIIGQRTLFRTLDGCSAAYIVSR